MDGESVVICPMLGLGLVIPIPTASADYPIADRHVYWSQEDLRILLGKYLYLKFF